MFPIGMMTSLLRCDDDDEDTGANETESSAGTFPYAYAGIGSWGGILASAFLFA